MEKKLATTENSKKNVFIRINNQKYNAPKLRLEIDAVSMDGANPLPNTKVVLELLGHRQEFATNEYGVARVIAEFTCVQQSIKDQLSTWLENINGTQKISEVVKYDLVSPVTESIAEQSQQKLKQTEQSLRLKTEECDLIEKEKIRLEQKRNRLIQQANSRMGEFQAEIIKLKAENSAKKQELDQKKTEIKELLGPENPPYELIVKQQGAKDNLQDWQLYYQNANAYYTKVKAKKIALGQALLEARRMDPIIKREHKRINEELEAINAQKRARVEELKNSKSYQKSSEDQERERKASTLRGEWCSIFPSGINDYKYQEKKTLTLYKSATKQGKISTTYNTPSGYSSSTYLVIENTPLQVDVLYQEDEYKIQKEALPAYDAYVQDLVKKYVSEEAELERAEAERKKAYEGLEKAEKYAKSLHIFPAQEKK